MGYRFRNPTMLMAFVLLLFTLALVVACGSSAAPEPSAEQPAPAQPDAPKEAGAAPKDAMTAPKDAMTAPKDTSAAPTAMAQPTMAPPAVAKPKGTLTMGQEEINIFSGHPKLSVNPQLFVISTAPVVEGLMAWNSDLEAVPLLLESWKISPDFLSWTFNIRKGIQFHKGYGEMTAEDVAWSYSQWVQNSKHARASALQRFWTHPEGSVEVQDSHTLLVNTGEAMPDVIMSEFHRIPSGIATWVTSKKQSEELGVEAADKDIAATGPWEIMEHRPAQFWKMRAVENHWRKTPEFAELVFQEIPEQSTRVAGFQTGLLDTFVMAFDSIPLVEKTPGPGSCRCPTRQPGKC